VFDCVVGAKICGRGMSESAVFVSRIQACRMMQELEKARDKTSKNAQKRQFNAVGV
jgi:hypothetical protein